MERIVILGATSEIAQQTQRILALGKKEMLLVARSADRFTRWRQTCASRRQAAHRIVCLALLPDLPVPAGHCSLERLRGVLTVTCFDAEKSKTLRQVGATILAVILFWAFAVSTYFKINLS